MKYTRPVYRDLYGWEDKRQLAVDTYRENRNRYMDVARNRLEQDLHIDS